MSVKVIRIDDTQDETLRILNAILSERRVWIEVSPSKVGSALGIQEGVVRYNIKKLVKLGYIRPIGRGYEPTDKVLFLNKK